MLKSCSLSVALPLIFSVSYKGIITLGCGMLATTVFTGLVLFSEI